MLSNKLVLALASARVAVAHFGLTYPLWRFDTLSEAGEAKYSQWTYPCKWHGARLLLLLPLSFLNLQQAPVSPTKLAM